MKTISVSRENFEVFMSASKHDDDIVITSKWHPGTEVHVEKYLVKSKTADSAPIQTGVYVVLNEDPCDYTETIMAMLKRGYRISSTAYSEGIYRAIMVLDNRKEV